MASSAEGPVAREPKGSAAKNGQARRKRSTPARRSKKPTVGELERVIEALEAQLAQFTSGRNIRSAVNGATSQVGRAVNRASSQMGDVVADTLTDVAGRFLHSATSVTGAAKMGTSAMRKIGTELERRPFMTVAIALGIGFLAGLAGRQQDSG